MRKHLLYMIGILSIAGIIFSILLGRVTGNEYFFVSFILGFSMFLETITYLLKSHSFLSDWHKHGKHLLLILLLGSLTGSLLFDVPAIFVFDIWEYPMSLTKYFILNFMGWGLFFLIFYQSYYLVHLALNRGHKDLGLHEKSKGYSQVFSYIGLIGIVLFIISIALMAFKAQPWYAASLGALGIWLVLENIEFQRTKRTLLYDIFTGNFRPLAAIAVGAFIIGFLCEYMNLPMQSWIYKNVPWPDWHIAGVPVFILLSWAWMYILFLSLYKIIYHGDRKLWK